MRRPLDRVVPRRLAPSAAIAATLALAGCGSSGGRPDDELKGLVVAEKVEVVALDPAAAAGDRDELARAVGAPHRRVGELLGPHVFRGRQKVEVKDEQDQVVQAYEETTLIELAEGGAFHARLENSADYGREVFYTDGTMLLAPRYSKFNKRPPADEDEPLRVRDEIFGGLAAQLELVIHAAELTDKGGSEVGGRGARTIAFKLAPGDHRAPAQKLPRRKWRESIVVRELAGEVSLDAETGAPLAGSLTAALSFRRDSKSFTMAVEVEHAIEAVGQSPTITLPAADQVVVVADHHREAAEREQLLEGIASPARKAPTPQNTTPGKGDK